MVTVTTHDDNLVFEVEGWDKLWSLRSRLEIPLTHIEGAEVDPHPAMGWFQGLKVAGSDIPNLFRAGTFYQDGELVFWDVRHPENTVVVNLEHERYAKLIVEVEDPQKTADLINDAIARYRSH